MRLLLVELTRFRARRAIVLTVLGAAILTAVLAASAIYDTRPVSGQEQARAEQLVQREVDSRRFERTLERCQENPERFLGPGSTSDACDQQLRPQVEWYLDRAPLDLARENEERGTAVLFLMLVIAVIVGTTFAGADWASGSVSNQLLFEPRRGRVWAGKAAAVVLGVATFAAVIVAGFWAALAVTAQLRGIDVPSAVITDIAQTAGRGIALAAGAGLGSYALTMLFRHTVGTLGVLFGYVVAGEALAAALPFPKMSQWALSNNILAWISDGQRVYDESVCPEGFGFDESSSCNPEYLLTFGHAAIYLGLLLALVTLLSVALFRRRDVP